LPEEEAGTWVPVFLYSSEEKGNAKQCAILYMQRKNNEKIRRKKL
jgi:hypothetical protein